MKKMTPEKKVRWIIFAAMTLMVVALITIVHYFKTLLNLPPVFLCACFVPFFAWGLNLFYKWLKKSKWKDTVDEIEKKYAVENAKSKPMPRIVGIAVIAIVCLGYSISLASGVIEDIVSNSYEQKCFLEMMLPNIISILTLLSCSMLITIIAYNVYRKKVFEYVNARLIYSIGLILIFSVIIQRHYWETTTMLPNDTVAINFSLIGIFILFLGRVFSIGVKIQEEQDLTI